jgi:N6-adenosine-specific RNA methylase IME4
MRKQAKLLANFLGATKELTSEYVGLAEITDNELNQIAFTVMQRDDRKTTARLLAGKGLSTREIAKITGWHFTTIAEDLKAVGNPTKSVGNPTPRPSTTGGREGARAAIAAASAAEGITDAPAEKYRVVLADPPWSYGNTQPDYHTEQRDHYPVMELAAICGLPVAQWVEDNAVLFLWATSPILEEAFEVIHAWGFRYKASFVWDKIKHNMGHYNSVRHEFLLICTRGSCEPDKQQLYDSVQSIERGKHSAKPVEFYDIIETLYTHGRRLEMFGRARRDGWDLYGHVAEIADAAE